MTITQKIIEDIYNSVARINNELSPQAIPHSDTFLKLVQSEVGLSAESARLALRYLVEAHKIFTIEIVVEDPKHNIEKVEGFIVAEASVVSTLKSYYSDLLCKIYEKQFHKHYMVHQVIKEVFPIIKSFNNTELGQITNKTIMLIEYERLLERNPIEYSVEWQEKKLLECAKREGFTYVPKIKIDAGEEFSDESTASPLAPSGEKVSLQQQRPAAQGTSNAFARAVDTPAYKEFSEKNDKYPLQRILNIYGLDFFIKVYLRKYQFGYLKRIVEDGQITRKNDLLLLKAMVDTTKSHMSIDSELNKYREDIYALERAVSHAIYFTSSMKNAQK